MLFTVIHQTLRFLSIFNFKIWQIEFLATINKDPWCTTWKTSYCSISHACYCTEPASIITIYTYAWYMMCLHLLLVLFFSIYNGWTAWLVWCFPLFRFLAVFFREQIICSILDWATQMVYCWWKLPALLFCLMLNLCNLLMECLVLSFGESNVWCFSFCFSM